MVFLILHSETTPSSAVLSIGGAAPLVEEDFLALLHTPSSCAMTLIRVFGSKW